MPDPLLGNQESFQLVRCHTFYRRLKGFQWRREIAAHEVLWLEPCWAVHTFGMRWPLSLIFLDRQAQPVHIVETAKPRRLFVCQGANAVLEMRARSETEIHRAWIQISIQINSRRS